MARSITILIDPNLVLTVLSTNPELLIVEIAKFYKSQEVTPRADPEIRKKLKAGHLKFTLPSNVSYTPATDISQPTCVTRSEDRMFKSLANAPADEADFKIINPVTRLPDEAFKAFVIQRYRESPAESSETIVTVAASGDGHIYTFGYTQTMVSFDSEASKCLSETINLLAFRFGTAYLRSNKVPSHQGELSFVKHHTAAFSISFVTRVLLDDFLVVEYLAAITVRKVTWTICGIRKLVVHEVLGLFLTGNNREWLGSSQIRCNWATKGAGTSDEKQASDSKSVAELTNGSLEDVKEPVNGDAPENNPQCTAVYVGGLAPEVRKYPSVNKTF
ncbi:hypothetical protein Tco_0771961 [Tanacetum coccineum]|uniref:PIN domain-containing protein n=1 Tax=Tanacetum coccineum TaxID=301880 RepID=A0ABQ4ZGW1_9ASTR